MSADAYRATPLWLKIVLWIAAVLCMAAAVIYQRLTGPTHPYRSSFEAGGESYSYRLIRSETTTTDATVRIPDPGSGRSATLHWRRYPTDEPFAAQAMTPADDATVSADLPRQPPAGKLEYYLTVEGAGGTIARLPADSHQNVVLRYKDPVPAVVLIPHIVMMFFAVLFGIRAGLAAIAAPAGMRWIAWTTLIGMTVGGMVLGPIVQKHAFGAYWTGWPFGGDLTDNKVLLMWLMWIVACSTIGFRPLKREWIGRLMVVIAALVMTAVYMIPHSMRGSELDYAAVDAGAAPSQAIGTADE